MTANTWTDHHDTATIMKRKHEIGLDQVVVDSKDDNVFPCKCCGWRRVNNGLGGCESLGFLCGSPVNYTWACF